MSEGLSNRVWSLRVGKPGEEGLRWGTPTAANSSDPEPTAIDFTVLLSSKPRDNLATISLRNISPASLGQLEEEGAIATLRAGWQALSGQIFGGTIAKRGVDTSRSDAPSHATTVRNSATFITTIEAGESELVLQDTFITKSFARATDNITILKSIASDLGVFLGEESLIDLLSYSGGWTYQGKADQALDELVKDIDAEWSIQAGQLLILKDGQSISEEAYVISPLSGMLGVPSVSKDGIELKSLLLAPLRPSRRIIVRSENVNGTYIIDEVTHAGSSRGQEWSSSIKAKAVK